MTRDKFYQYASYNTVSHWIAKFHAATSFSGERTPDRIFWGLSDISRSIGRVQKLIAIAGMRPDASPLIMGQWNLICDLHKQGYIDTELKKAANSAARFNAFNLGLRFKHLQDILTNKIAYWEKDGDNGVERILSLANITLNRIEQAGEHYQPREMGYEERYEDRENGIQHRPVVLQYSAEEITRIAQECALLMCRSYVIIAQEQFAAQEFSKRGGGFREEMLRFREILGYLDLARFDLDAEDTYAKIGTTKKEFLTCFHFESENAGRPPVYSGYVGVRTDFPQRFKLQP